MQIDSIHLFLIVVKYVCLCCTIQIELQTEIHDITSRYLVATELISCCCFELQAVFTRRKLFGHDNSNQRGWRRCRITSEVYKTRKSFQILFWKHSSVPSQTCKKFSSIHCRTSKESSAAQITNGENDGTRRWGYDSPYDRL